MQNTTQTATVDTLNGFLRGEISAVETYRQALDKLQSSPSRVQLEQCRRSHEERVSRLRQEVVRLGGKPEEGSGAWGAFAKLVDVAGRLRWPSPPLAEATVAAKLRKDRVACPTDLSRLSRF